MRRLQAAIEWLHDPEIANHPRYWAWERRHVLAAVRAGSLTLAIVLAADTVLLWPVSSQLAVINIPGALIAAATFLALRRSGEARRNPVAGAYVLGATTIATTLLPIALIPGMGRLMVAYVPIVLMASALFIPWTVRWHAPWLVAALGVVIAFAQSPLAAPLGEDGIRELLTITIGSTLVSFAGHVVLQRERRRTFTQRLQLRRVNATARRQRRELEALAAQLEQVARRDPLTGVGNRLRLDEDAAVLISSLGRLERPASAILIDIDHFKDYNDRHGHLAGDAVLREVARTLAINLRPHDRIYRFGGEEFLVLLDGTDAPGAAVAADRLRDAVVALAIPNPGNQPWGVLTISAGVASIDADHRERDAWVRAADERLYESKALGRNRVTAERGAEPDSAAADPAA